MPNNDFTSPGTSRFALEAAYIDRLKEAQALYDASCYAAAIASSLYALEICLKAKICQRLDLDSLPRVFQIHNLNGLLVLAGISKRVNSLPDHDPVKYAWGRLLSLTDRHVNELRYHPDNPANQPEACLILDCLKDPAMGVIEWLKLQT